MTKKRISLLLVLILCLCVVLSAPAAYAAAERSGNELLIDEADLLTYSEEARLRARLEAITEQYQAEVIIITLEDMDGADADDYIEHLYDSLGYGCGVNRDGVMLMISMDERDYRILSNGFAADAISMGDIEDISDAIVSDLSDGNYAEAFAVFAEECEYYLNGHINGFPFEFGMNLVIALAIGMLAGVIVAFILKGQLKSVRRQHQANNYVRSGSMQLTTAYELFLYRNVSRVKRQESSSSSSRSGGSSRNVGGGKF